MHPIPTLVADPCKFMGHEGRQLRMILRCKEGTGWADGGDFFGMNGLIRYECGGRLGEGLFELTELRSPLARHVTELNLKGS
jgi:hypothetical protein